MPFDEGLVASIRTSDGRIFWYTTAEAPDAEQLVRRFFDDPVRGTEISPWLPLFDGPLHRAYEVYHWSGIEGA